MTRMLSRLPTFAACLLTVSSGTPVLAQESRVLSLATSASDDGTLFVAEIRRPADCGTLSVEPGGDWRWSLGSADGLPVRVPLLQSSPVWMAPAYLDFAGPADLEPQVEPEEEQDPQDAPPQGPLDPLVFIGRAPAGTGALDLTLRYPSGDGESWVETPIHLDLASAAGNSRPTAVRLALAKAKWFQLFATQSPDTGGFFAFAEQQTRRRAGLPTRAEEAGMRRDWTDPSRERFALASGALAIQEALQLDRMTTAPVAAAPTIPIADIKPVRIASHDYDKMRGESQPVDTPLSRLAPADNWYLRFASVSKLLELADFADRWGSSLLRLATASGQDFGVRRHLLTQLCLSDGPAVRALGPAVIGEVAFTGSDAYLRLGSDVTALFAVKNRVLFTAAMEPFIQQALTAGAVRDTITVGSLQVERIRTPDRRISCSRAWIGDVCLYSNSDAALSRISAAAAGTLPALADAPDFKFIRATVFPYAADAEDGLLFLSDAFVRRSVSPGLRIAQLRRLQAYTSLKLIANARMLYGWDRGPGQPTLADLESGGFLTPADLVDSLGTDFSLDPRTGIASGPSGSLPFMRPLIETPVETATEAERDAYITFRNQYRSYWQRFIDPVAIRIGVGPTITLETHILPLIDLSEYKSLQDFAGGPPITVEPAKFSPNTLFRLVTKLGPGQMRRSMITWAGAFSGTNATSDWLGDWATFWVEDSDSLAALVRGAYGQSQDFDGPMDFFRASIVGGVHVRNKLSLATFLVGLRAVIDQSAPNTVIYTTLEPRAGVTIVKVSPDPGGDLASELSRQAERDQDKPPLEPALYYATIGDGFFLATQQASLDRLIDAQAPADPKAAPAAPLPSDSANFFLYAAPGAVGSSRPALGAILESQALRASMSNLAHLELLGRCALLEGRDPAHAGPAFLGFRPVDPDGGSYSFDAATGIARSTSHGTRWVPLAQPGPLPAISPLADLLERLKTISAALRFTEDGLETTVRIRRE